MKVDPKKYDFVAVITPVEDHYLIKHYAKGHLEYTEYINEKEYQSRYRKELTK
jgi:hypothetical protein